MKDHAIMWFHGWSACMLLLVLLLLSFVMNIFVLADFIPESDSLQHHQKSLCHKHEKSALLRFKHSFLIDCSESDAAFARPKVMSWQSDNDHISNDGAADCCRTWDGVKCDEETGHVVGLDLSSSCLSGTFPRNSTIFDLDHLQELDLSDNFFNYSRIPSTIHRLSELTRLNLSYSLFSGPITFGISTMSKLSVLDLSSYLQEPPLELLQHDMSFEKLIRNLTYLTALKLDNVDISDVVPVILRNFTSLKSLSLDGCNLHGDFPTEVLKLPNLEQVILRLNSYLRGHLPEFPPNRPLKKLDLLHTSFSGILTPSIGNLASLTCLHLSETDFTGSIPLSIANLTQLTILSMPQVHVSPRILNPLLHKLTNLQYLALNHMNISSEFPSAIANLTKLQWLDVGGNQLRGPLPNWLANLTELSFLDLRGNQFRGSLIPQWFSQLIKLEKLFLDSHQSSVSLIDPLLKLPKLKHLEITRVNLIIPPNNNITNHSSLPKFNFLELEFCNLTEFPPFLHHQNELEVMTLYGNNIVGVIPQWFVNATAGRLRCLKLSSNIIMGFEQPQDFLPWNNLEYLSIKDNMFHGRLPSPPPNLAVYDVSQNEMSGVIPKQICKGSSLISLDVSSNNFSGEIPSCIGHQLSSSLRVLNLGSNHFQGKVPQKFANACKLQIIDLSENRLEGQLPKSLSNCKELELLNVGSNCLHDTFPSWLTSLPKLQILILRYNNFYGKIATYVSDQHFRLLHIVDVSNNNFDGELSSVLVQSLPAMQVTKESKMSYSYSSEISLSFSEEYIIVSYPFSINITNKGTERSFQKILTVFRVFDFSSNNFTGVIPQVLGNLRGLQALNLSNNNLGGDIPSSLANIVDLQSLDLSRNMLTGQIPQQLTKLTPLEIFIVSHNRLVGLIPQGNQFSSFHNSSFVGNLALCGAPLSNKCQHTDSLQPPPPPPPPGDKTTEEDSMLVDWIIRLLGCAGGLIVGYVIGKIYITDRHHDWFVETFGRRKPPKPKARNSAPRFRRNP